MRKHLLSLLVIMMFGINSFAQMAMPLPMDPNVRYGKLDNGMTY